ncbi:hypothetical protein POM88_041628 [Heracleum sosnowskyi]|uniref:Aminotransferase-like plant mobile domain-containing protein n=1 Tax=Heracleum sosnowskyi TaxID=360622 RepID=A0AAD8HEM2_9APIA|nr:hypothetical protein POM88_041628 [Heracleum sosnowskyi]
MLEVLQAAAMWFNISHDPQTYFRDQQLEFYDNYFPDLKAESLAARTIMDGEDDSLSMDPRPRDPSVLHLQPIHRIGSPPEGSDKLDSCGKLSWGSVVLGYLYMELCKSCKKYKDETAGCVLLLQLWAWSRLHSLAPVPRAPIVDNYDIWGTLLGPRGLSVHLDDEGGVPVSETYAHVEDAQSPSYASKRQHFVQEAELQQEASIQPPLQQPPPPMNQQHQPAEQQSPMNQQLPLTQKQQLANQVPPTQAAEQYQRVSPVQVAQQHQASPVQVAQQLQQPGQREHTMQL